MSNMNPEELPNPYDTRNHEDGHAIDHSDVLAVAGLVGQISGTLSEIDTKMVGSDSANVRASQIHDTKAALAKIVGTTGTVQKPKAVANHPAPSPQTHPQPMPSRQNNISQAGSQILEERIANLEEIVATYKKIIKFKRGVSYMVNTSTIKGEFKTPSDILDIVAAELAKGSKNITIKLNDSTKIKK